MWVLKAVKCCIKRNQNFVCANDRELGTAENINDILCQWVAEHQAIYFVEDGLHR